MSDDKLARIQLKFLSGNNVPVESARIKKDEFQYLMDMITQLRQQLAEAKTQLEGGFVFSIDVNPAPVVPLKEHCQNGRADICLAGSQDGICCPDDECDIDEGLRKAAQENSAPVVPDGYVMVPVDPTDAMIDAGLEVCGMSQTAIRVMRRIMKEEYQAMLSAAQEKAE